MIKISVVGDFLMKYAEETMISDELRCFFKENHINAVNFEAPVESNGKAIIKSGPVIAQSPKSPSYLENLGFNMISLSNNHTMDYGVDAFLETKNSFKKAKTVGAGNWEEAYKMEIIEVAGKKIGFMALTHCEFGTLTDRWDKKNTVGCAWINHGCVDGLIIKYKQEVDALIVLVHAGVEYLDFPLPEWRDRYRQLIERGADAVIASHPHVPQGWEEHLEKPVFYSLGNFCFQTEQEILRPYWNDSLCVLLEFDENMNLSYQVKNIRYNSLKIDFCNDSEIRKHVEDCLSYLSDDALYMSKVNQAVIELMSLYDSLFKMGNNAVKCDRSIKSFFRFFKRSLFHKEEPEHLLNILRCESHRWGVQRAMKILYDLN